MVQQRCFVITPIGAPGDEARRHADMMFEVVLKPLFDEKGYSIDRSDTIADAGQITSAIFQAIEQSEICIADLSFLNPNVLYELGVRHTLQKHVIQIAALGTKLPFDTANQRTIFFDLGDIHSLKSLRTQIEQQLDRINVTPDAVSNPFTHALGLRQIKLSGDSQAELIADLATRIEALELAPVHLGNETAGAIVGQGDLATMNFADVMQIWRLDQKLQSVSWNAAEDGAQSGKYQGFSIRISPQNRGRWSSSAVHDDTGFSIPYPTWRQTAEQAKAAIIGAIDDHLKELSTR